MFLNLTHLLLPKAAGQRQKPKRPFRPRFELLEDRWVPATLYVSPSGHLGNHTAFTTIQAAVSAAHANDEINVGPGTYTEQVTIPAADNGLELESTEHWKAIIKAPATMTGNHAIVDVAGTKHVSIEGFTITGPSSSLRYGIRIDSGGSAVIEDNHITNIREDPLSSDQTGVAILVGRSSEGTIGSAEIEHNVIDNYQKGGIVVSNAGSSAVIEHNKITGAGPTAVIAQNGIQVDDGAKAEIEHNDISGNVYTPQTVVGTGILLVNPGHVVVEHNSAEGNDVGIYAVGATGAVISHNDASNNTYDGIDLDGTTGAVVEHNRTSDNGNDGIALFDNAMNNVVDHNQSGKNGHDGISVEAGSTGNKFTHNQLLNNAVFDAEDNTTGTGTAGTGNFWDDNQLKKDNKGGGLGH